MPPPLNPSSPPPSLKVIQRQRGRVHSVFNGHEARDDASSSRHDEDHGRGREEQEGIECGVLQEVQLCVDTGTNTSGTALRGRAHPSTCSRMNRLAYPPSSPSPPEERTSAQSPSPTSRSAASHPVEEYSFSTTAIVTTPPATEAAHILPPHDLHAHAPARTARRRHPTRRLRDGSCTHTEPPLSACPARQQEPRRGRPDPGLHA
jgi:hypothetical protein